MKLKIAKNLYKLKKLFRNRGQLESRKNFLRLEKNEKTTPFKRKILNYLKKNITSFHITGYPEIESVYLNLSKYLKINKENLVITGGADLGIKNCFELFTNSKDRIITISPTFAMIDIYSTLFNVKQEKFFFNKKLELDLKKIEKKINPKIKMIIISNPNNPTGTFIKKEIMLKLISKANKFKIPFVIDEVYYGFTNQTFIKYINKYKNLVIIRTFSKSFGLAALRAGYIVANKNLAQLLYKFKPMYEISSITALMVNFFIKNNKLEKRNLIEFEEGRNFFLNHLEKMKISFITTKTNFIHIKTKNNAAKNVLIKYFYKNKILVRDGGPGIKGYENYLRVTIGSRPQMNKLIKLIIKKKELF